MNKKIQVLKMFVYQMSIFFLLMVAQVLADPWNGSDYANNSSVQLSHAERLISNLVLQGNETILDLGCGDGKITALLSKKVPKGSVIGLDPSLSMLAKAKEISNLKFYQGFAENFLLEERFDHVIAIHVMHWIKEQEKALKNIYNHLNPKGQVHFILAPSKEGLPFDRALQKTVTRWSDQLSDFVNPQQVFDMETYRKLMVEAGFHIEEVHYVYDESFHADKEKLKNWVKQWLPHGKHLGDEQDVFLNELIDNYLLEIDVPLNSLELVPWSEYVLIVAATRR